MAGFDELRPAAFGQKRIFGSAEKLGFQMRLSLRNELSMIADIGIILSGLLAWEKSKYGERAKYSECR